MIMMNHMYTQYTSAVHDYMYTTKPTTDLMGLWRECFFLVGVVLYFFQEGLSLLITPLGIISLVCFHDLAVEIQVYALLVVLAIVGCLLSLKGFWSFGLDRHRIKFLWTLFYDYYCVCCSIESTNLIYRYRFFESVPIIGLSTVPIQVPGYSYVFKG